MINPILAEMQAARWAMEPSALSAFIEQIASITESSQLPHVAIDRQVPAISVVGDTASITISGVLLKTVPGWMKMWGVNVTGYDDLRDLVAQAVASPAVKNIELLVSSPGGMVSGCMETGKIIAEAASVKNVTASVEDLCASGAFWLTAQASEIEASPTSEVGSIGVYTVAVDYSGYAESEGIKVTVIRSGEHKGMGVPGAPITDSQIAAVQDVIDAMAEHFIEAVASGRGMEIKDVRALADGRCWIAAAAQEHGLIDSVTNMQPETDSDTADGNAAAQSGDITMDQDTKKDTAPVVDADAVTQQAQAAERARMTALQTEFSDDPAFAMEQFSAGASVTEAKAAYCDKLRAAAAAKDAEKVDGAEPVPYSASSEDSSGDFMAEARQRAAERNITVTVAMKQLKKEKPAMYEAFRAAELVRPDGIKPKRK